VHKEGLRVCTEVGRTPLLQLRCSSITKYYYTPPLLRYYKKYTNYRLMETPWQPIIQLVFIKFGAECVENFVIFTLYPIVTNLDILRIEIQIRHTLQKC